MPCQIVVVTTSEHVHQYVGIKKISVIPKDVREKMPIFFDQTIVSSLLIGNMENIEGEVTSRVMTYTKKRFNVILLVEDKIISHTYNLCESCFVVAYDSKFIGKSIQNYFSQIMSKIVVGFDYYNVQFKRRNYMKMFLLPLNNFISSELYDFSSVFTKSVVIKGFQDKVDKYLKVMRERQHPKTQTKYNTTYLIDDNRNYYEYGYENHAKPESGDPHNLICIINSTNRFGSAYDSGKHYNVTKEQNQISGIFSNCHQEKTQVSSRTHINMFPNGHIA